jgi:parallel beta-helix repeat protein
VAETNRHMEGIHITVGHENADIVATDNRGLQAAVDFVAALGGGLVNMGPGEYLMNDSLHLRSGVDIRGSGQDTILRKCDGCLSKLFLDGDHGEEQVTLVDPSGFQIGMGISVLDDRSQGFHTSVATIIGIKDDAFLLNRPLVTDCLVTENARASNAFPVISGYYVSNVRIENISIDGNKDSNHPITGCRGAGLYLYGASNVRIQGVTVKDFNGDGISYQKSDDVVVTDCIVSGNTTFGMHPGSGSQRTVIKGCEIVCNGQDGIFVCWRVQQGLFEGNQLLGNASAGLSIGHKDTDNVIRENLIKKNGRYGILFRHELPQMGAHRNLIEGNTIQDNGAPHHRGYGIMIESDVQQVTITENTIGNSEPEANQVFSIYSKSAHEVTFVGNKVDSNLAEFGSLRKE